MIPLKAPRLSLEKLLDQQRRQDFPVKQMIPVAEDGGGGLYYLHEVTQKVFYSHLEAEDDFLCICTGLSRFYQILEAAYQRAPETPFDINKQTRREESMEQNEYLPLGSIVVLQGGIRKVMIIARGMNVKRDGETYFVDYGGVLYPEGLTGDQMVYFNKEGISKVYFHGYRDDDDDIVMNALNEYLDAHPNINRANPALWNASAETGEDNTPKS